MEPFLIRIADLQPSQLYVCREKLAVVERSIDARERLEPVPIKELDGRLVFSDGHTRALAALLRGETKIEAHWEDEPLDWDVYRVCVGWCLAEEIRTVADLKDRIIAAAEYETQWIGRCRAMHEEWAGNRHAEETR